jgi:hypothetical protein
VRGLLIDWLAKVPEGSDRNALQGTLASRKNDESFESGFWELYLHEAYRRSGYTITIHPDVRGRSVISPLTSYGTSLAKSSLSFYNGNCVEIADLSG